MDILDVKRLWGEYGSNPGRFLLTFLDNRRVFLRGTVPRRGPLAAIFNLSNRCNAKCRFCDYWRSGPAEKSELPTAKKIAILKELAQAGVWLLSLCSAEPLLSEDIDEVIAEAKRQRMLVNVSTNGAVLEQSVEMLIDMGVDRVTVSIDSHEAAIHDEARGGAGLFDRMERGVEYLRKSRKAADRPLVVARCLVSGKNCFAIREFVEYWRDKTDRIVLKPIYESPDGLFHIPEEMIPRQEKEAEFRDYFAEILEQYPELDSQYHRLVPDHLFGKGHDASWYCFAGTFYTDIDCEGNIYPCAEFGSGFGNILEKSFMDIWRSEPLRGFRGELKEKKKCPGCWGDKFIADMQVQKAMDFLGGIG